MTTDDTEKLDDAIDRVLGPDCEELLKKRARKFIDDMMDEIQDHIEHHLRNIMKERLHSEAWSLFWGFVGELRAGDTIAIENFLRTPRDDKVRQREVARMAWQNEGSAAIRRELVNLIKDQACAERVRDLEAQLEMEREKAEKDKRDAYRGGASAFAHALTRLLAQGTGTAAPYTSIGEAWREMFPGEEGL